jgi:hypothetical protein
VGGGTPSPTRSFDENTNFRTTWKDNLMRIPIFLTILGASTLALAAHAQDTQPAPPADQPVAAQPAPGDPAPADGGTSTMPVAPASDSAAPPPPPSAFNAVPDAATPAADAPPATVMAQGAPVVQDAPPPPADYPLCSRTVRDSCRNPGGR